MDSLKCGICGQEFKAKSTLTVHVGVKHGKISDVLKEKGFKKLPAPVESRNQEEMQRNLQSIKKEKFESSLCESTSGDTNTRAEDPFKFENDKGDPDFHSRNLERILQKYNQPSKTNHGV